MALDLGPLETEVTAVEGADASAELLITRLAAEIAANKNDPVALQKLADRLKARSSSLAAAVAANSGTPNPQP